MNWESWIIGGAFLASGIPGIVFLRNFFRYRSYFKENTKVSKERAGRTSSLKDRNAKTANPVLSILIPARNEELRLPGLLESILAQKTSQDLEILILDDQSEDRTSEVIQQFQKKDSRIHRLAGSPLPRGWCGKQWACWSLARKAHGRWLLFLDADVRIEPGSIDHWIQSAENSGADLISGIPRQITGSILEKLCIPLIHFILLSFLPIWRMRRSNHPSYAAGCGQWMLVSAEAYHQSGGHRAMAASLHDGIHLPRTLRQAGFKTDLMDLTSTVSCRMYQNAVEVWEGLMKNAREGMGAPSRILPVTLLLFAGQILPWILIIFAWNQISLEWRPYTIAALAFSMLPRLLGAFKYQQSRLSAFLHPVGITLFLSIQWIALWRSWHGVHASWKGRTYPHGQNEILVASKVNNPTPDPNKGTA